MGLFQRFQHSLSQVLVLADDCVSVPDVHHLLDDTNTHNQDISLYLRNKSQLFVASVSGFHCRVESYNIAHNVRVASSAMSWFKNKRLLDNQPRMSDMYIMV